MFESDFQGMFSKWCKECTGLGAKPDFSIKKSEPKFSAPPVEEWGPILQEILGGSASMAFELKFSDEGGRIAFSQVEEHQAHALRCAEGIRELQGVATGGEPGPLTYEADGRSFRVLPVPSGRAFGVYMKHTDLSLGKKPYDCSILRGWGVVVYGWHHVGRGVEAYAFRIGEWDRIREEKARACLRGFKSLTEGEAMAYGEYLGRFVA